MVDRLVVRIRHTGRVRWATCGLCGERFFLPTYTRADLYRGEELVAEHICRKCLDLGPCGAARRVINRVATSDAPDENLRNLADIVTMVLPENWAIGRELLEADTQSWAELSDDIPPEFKE